MRQSVDRLCISAFLTLTLLLSGLPPGPGHAAASSPHQNDPVTPFDCETQPFTYTVDWVQQFGTQERDRGLALTVNDETGQLIVTGSTRGSLAGENAGGARAIDRDDLWYGDWNPATGERVWWEQTGTDQADIPYGTDLLVSGEAGVDSVYYLAGRTGLNEGYGWIERVNPLGELDSTYVGTIPDEDRVRFTPGAVGVDASGAAYWGGTRLNGGTSASSGWVRKYASTGSVNWSTTIADTHNLLDLVVNGEAGFVAAGMTPRIDNDQDGWVAAFDINGSELWRQTLGSDKRDEPTAVAADRVGNLYVAGNTGGNIAGENQGSSSSTDGWLAKYDASGNRLDVIQFGTSGSDKVAAMTLIPETETLVLVGTTAGDLAGESSGSTDMWLAEFDHDLTLLGCIQFGTAGIDTAADVAVDFDGNVYLAGYVNLSAWEGFENEGGEDGVILKISGVVNDPLADLVFLPEGEGWTLNSDVLAAESETILSTNDLLEYRCSLTQSADRSKTSNVGCELSRARITARCQEVRERLLLLLELFPPLQETGIVAYTAAEIFFTNKYRCPGEDAGATQAAMTTAADLQFGLSQGAIEFMQVDKSIAVDTLTGVGTVHATGNAAYWVNYDADTLVTTVIAHDGTVTVAPTAKPLEVILQKGELVTVSETEVGPIIRLKRVYLPYLAR